jgi:AcrR family transcriptional regulator
MSARDRWIDEGLAVLADRGIAGVSIDGLAGRLGLTKGSFHHHFAGMPGFRIALLERYRAGFDQGLAGAEALLTTSVSPLAALQRFPELLNELDLRLATAVRSWALADPEARAVQAQIDRRWRGLLEGVWGRIVDDPERARTAALLPYLVLVGAAFAVPPVTADDIAAVMAMLAELAAEL